MTHRRGHRPARTGHHRGGRRLALGYSMLEMVAATALAGSLSAAAMPRLMGWTQEARVAVVRSMEGAVHSASNLVHMKCAVSLGCMRAGQASLPVEGGLVDLAAGYPAGGHEGGIANALAYKGFDTVHVAGVATVFRQQGAPDPSRCAVTYRSATDGGPPRISSELSGC